MRMTSPLPPNTSAMLYSSGGDWVLPGQDDEPCEGAAFHSPRPLFTHDTPLVLKTWWSEEQQWMQTRAPQANLCGTCADNLNILLQMLHATVGDLDWEVRREFGNTLRALALRGWEWFASKRPARVNEPTT